LLVRLPHRLTVLLRISARQVKSGPPAAYDTS
jgi:hypothetical protein